MISLKNAHDLHFGAQDRYDAAAFVGKYPCVGEVQYSHKETIPGNRKVTVTLCRNGASTGIANLHITGDWKYAEFEVGGQRFDKIYPMMDVDGFWYVQGDRTFPHLMYHDLKIILEAGPGGASVSWDGVTVNRLSSENDYPLAELYAMGHQYTGSETLVRGKSKMRLNFNHPVFSLYVKTSKPVSRLRLQLNEYMLEVPFVWNSKYGRWEAVFQEIPDDGVPRSSAKTINFSRVDAPVLHVEHECDTVEVDVWANTSQLTRIMSGMAGLAFSK